MRPDQVASSRSEVKYDSFRCPLSILVIGGLGAVYFGLLPRLQRSSDVCCDIWRYLLQHP